MGVGQSGGGRRKKNTFFVRLCISRAERSSKAQDERASEGASAAERGKEREQKAGLILES